MTSFFKAAKQKIQPVNDIINDVVYILGLHDSGKSAIFNRLAMNIFTYEFLYGIRWRSETVDLGQNSRPMDITDMDGHPLGSSYYHFLGTTDPRHHGFIFVVDSSVPYQPEELAAFRSVTSIRSLERLPILVFVTKQDLLPCRTSSEVVENLNLNSLENRLWHIESCSAYTGDGVKEGVLELSRMIKYLRKESEDI